MNKYPDITVVSILICLFISVPALTFPPAGWEYDCPEFPASIAYPNNRNLRVDASGDLHVAYGLYQMYYARYDGSVWHREIVDNNPGGYWSSLALDLNGYPHVLYRSYDGYTLRYAFKDGSGWHHEILYSAPYKNSCTFIEFGSDGFPRILFQDYGSTSVKPLIFGYRDASGWHYEVIGDTGNNDNQYALYIDSNNYPHISYCDGSLSSSNGLLKYTYKDVSGWHTEVLESGIRSLTGRSSILLNNQQRAMIAYTIDSTAFSGTRLATRTEENTWLKEDISTSTTTAPSLMLDLDGYPHIALASTATSAFSCAAYHVFKNEGGWHEEYIEEEAARGFEMSLAIDDNGTLSAFYHDNGSPFEIRFARKESGGSWNSGLVDYFNSLGPYSSMQLDSSDNPRIAYIDGALKQVKYAEWDGLQWRVEIIYEGLHDDFNDYTSICLDQSGNPHIVFSDDDMGVLGYIWREGRNWHTEMHPGAIVPVYNSILIDSEGIPHIMHVNCLNNYSGGDLHYSTFDDSGWHHTQIDGSINSRVIREVSMAFDSEGTIHLAYVDWTHKRLIYAYQNDDDWVMTEVDTPETIGTAYQARIAMDSEDRPHIASTNLPLNDGPIVYSYFDDVWHSEIVAIHGGSWGGGFLALDPQNNPHIAYQTRQQELKYTWKDQSGWHPEDLDSAGTWIPNIQINSSGQPVICYDRYNSIGILTKTGVAMTPTPTNPPSTFSPTPSVTPSQIPPTHTPTPTPTNQTATPTGQPPTITPTPEDYVTFSLILDDNDLGSGDLFNLHFTLANPTTTVFEGDIYILLGLGSDYWCWPSWINIQQGIDKKTCSAEPTSQYSETALMFEWPFGFGAADGLMFIGAVFSPGTWDLVGNVQTIAWKFH